MGEIWGVGVRKVRMGGGARIWGFVGFWWHTTHDVGYSLQWIIYQGTMPTPIITKAVEEVTSGGFVLVEVGTKRSTIARE